MAVQRKSLAFALAVVLAAVAGGAAYLRYFQPRDEEPKALILYGNVDIRQVDLAFNVEGRIDAMLAEEGDPIHKGQVLARLDGIRYQAMVDAARATAEAQKAVVGRLEAGSRPQEIEKARADVRAAEANWNITQSTLERQRKLAVDRFASQQALDEAHAAERQARGQLEALRQVLALAIAGPREQDIAEAKAKLSAARADLALAESHLDDTILYAPAEGIALNRIEEPGAVIQANSPVYVLALSDPVWVRAYVSEPDLGRVSPGMKAEITTDTAPGHPYEGWVGFISPTAEFTPKTVQTTDIRTSLVYRLRVYAENPDSGLRQGMPVTVRLIEQPGRGATSGAAPGG